ncbi:YrhK family protein [Streptomyces sp. NPDC014864]|uniref:YrhK family protein n=1 Tax=Streptomyces sp. NPDC014864 TaxID=3364924 RepID=UPI0036F76B2C
MSKGLFDPRRAAASPRHAEIYGRYQIIYTTVEFAAAVAFVIGSAFFFSDSMALPADWLFLVGSMLFAVRPTVSVLRESHLARLPLPGDDQRAQQTAGSGANRHG